MNKAKLIIAVGVAAILTFLYIGNLKKDARISVMEKHISELSNKNAVLDARVESYKKLFLADKTATKELQEALDQGRKEEKETLAEIHNLPKPEGVKDGEARMSDRLPADLVRLLNRHCDKVRGSACDNP